jgi:ornithine lipid hydroxylase
MSPTARFHFLDIVLQVILQFSPLYLVGLCSEDIFFWHLIFYNVVGLLSHCNINAECGIFNYIFNTPELHRWHHSKKIVENNTNYGQILCVWDLAFGTWLLPHDGALPPENIGNKRFGGNTLSGIVLYPFRKWKREIGRRVGSGER